MTSKLKKYPSPKEAFSFSLKSIHEIKDEALVILDANVLLLPFTANVKNLSVIKGIYSRLCKNDQLFLPAQAIREYLDNRAIKISDINEALEKKASQSFNYVGSQPLLESLPEFKELSELEGDLKAIIKSYQKKIRDTIESMHAWGWDDPVSKMYHDILADRVLNDEHIDNNTLDKDLKFRNENNIPPGFKDKAKDYNKGGDLIIWYEILHLAKEKEKDVIFVSVDEKTDWWHQSGKSPLYPRFELVDEFRDKTGGKSFHIVSLSRLLEIFGTDSKIVQSVKSIEDEAKVNSGEHTEEKVITKISYDMDNEYRKHLKIPAEHGIISRHLDWKQKGGYDTDTYLISEFDNNGKIVREYHVFDSTKMLPPFSREIHSEKVLKHRL
ncbi:PIN-like domain-containing protein [Rosenbergiella epipactidis]|uniref:PIN-like domain-containing protein n=1 Tax=Rosenbergiella epipactidis TaxID=1544694 RepID=UPI001F4FBB1A|nr:PIN-like domain-containing protein [Rosenbergiella epipactidis]